MGEFVTKKQYMEEQAKYLNWCKIIRVLSFGKLDLTEAVDDLMSDKIIINI